MTICKAYVFDWERNELWEKDAQARGVISELEDCLTQPIPEVGGASQGLNCAYN